MQAPSLSTREALAGMEGLDLNKIELLLVARKGKYNLECWLLNGPKKERISDVQGVEDLKFIKKYGQGVVMGGRDEARVVVWENGDWRLKSVVKWAHGSYPSSACITSKCLIVGFNDGAVGAYVLPDTEAVREGMEVKNGPIFLGNAHGTECEGVKVSVFDPVTSDDDNEGKGMIKCTCIVSTDAKGR